MTVSESPPADGTDMAPARERNTGDGDAHAEATIATLRRLLGPERVRVGKDGFDQVCRELGVDEPIVEQARLF